MRMIYVCKRKGCELVRRIEYPLGELVSLGYGRTKRRYYRIDSTRGQVNAGYDAACVCGSHSHGAIVQGYKTEHPCDIRCTDARGHKCECSCGGANHGRAFDPGAAKRIEQMSIFA
jgi:hypothetical protein